MNEEEMRFDDASNYRGSLLVKTEAGKFFWRVDCDFDEYEDWNEIPGYLYEALRRHHLEKTPNVADKRQTNVPV